MDTHDVPAVVKLASKEFHITDSESTGVLQRLIESNDLTLYGLSNAVTRHSRMWRVMTAPVNWKALVTVF